MYLMIIMKHKEVERWLSSERILKLKKERQFVHGVGRMSGVLRVLRRYCEVRQAES